MVKIVVFLEAFTQEYIPQNSDSWNLSERSALLIKGIRRKIGWFNPVDITSRVLSGNLVAVMYGSCRYICHESSDKLVMLGKGSLGRKVCHPPQGSKV